MTCFAANRFAAALCLALALPWVSVQAQGLSDSERAQRDADKVFNFIKFHAVRAKAAPVVAVQAAAPAAQTLTPARARPAATSTTTAASAEPGTPRASLGDPQPGTSLPPSSEPVAELPPPSAPAQAQPAPAVPEAEPELVALKLLHHVQPELPRGGNLRDGTVRVRFTVEADGRVGKAAALEGGPRRLGQAAVRAVEQWRFAQLSQAQEVEVDFEFRFGD